MMEYKIGDKVVIKDYKDLPADFRNKRNAVCCGKQGEIVDLMYSQAKKAMVYRIRIDGKTIVSRSDFPEQAFKLVPKSPPAYYDIEFTYLDNVVVARMFEIQGDNKTEIQKGHGHIIHDGAEGIAQAASYALMRLYRKFEN